MKPILKNILSALAVIVFGFILLGLTFIFDALFQNVIDAFVKLFTPVDFNMTWHWYPPLKHGLFVILIGVISWFLFKSKLKEIYKAIFMVVPLAVVYATIGIFFYQLQAVPLLLGILFGLGVLYYLYKTKQPWLYYFSLITVSIMMLCVVLFNVEI